MIEQRVRDWMTRHIVDVAPDDALYVAVELMAERRLRHILVRRGEALLGILSNRDVVRATRCDAEGRLDLHGTEVRQVMTPCPLVTTAPEATLGHAAALMLDNKVNALPVLEGGQPCGILTSEDVLAAVAHAAVPTRRADV